MKKFFVSIILILSILLQPMVPSAYGANTGIGQDSNGNSVGPFAISDEFCQNFTKMSAILNAFQVVQWPVAGFPGIVVGLTQRTSVIHDVCDFLTQLETKSGVNAIFFAANYLNELTGKKWDEHLKFADKTWNLANTIYDFDNGQMRKSTLVSQNTARELNDWMESAYHWHAKTFNGDDAYVKHRQEREAEMRQYAQKSYQRATLSEALRCPGGDEDRQDYQKVYRTEVRKVEKDRDDAQQDIEYFRQGLYNMGPKMANNKEELDSFVAMLNDMVKNGVTYKSTQKVIKKGSTTVDPSMVDSSGHPIVHDSKIDFIYYVYSIDQSAPNGNPFDKFKQRWSKQWNTYIDGKTVSSGSFGILTGAGKDRIVETEFQDLNYECRPIKVTAGLDQSRDDYDKLAKSAMDKCREDHRVNVKDLGGLLNYFTDHLHDSIVLWKQSNATIWSTESKYTGSHRLLDVTSSNSSSGQMNFQQQQAACKRDNLSPAELQLLSAKMQDTNNELIDMQTQLAIKQNAREENERLEVQKEIQKHEQMDKMAQEKQQTVKDGLLQSTNLEPQTHIFTK